MIVLAIDPGPVRSAAIWLVGDAVQQVGIFGNEELLALLHRVPADHLAVEMIASYGMAVGKEVFETCVWIGRFIQAFDGPYTQVYRKEVCLHLCGSARAKDSNVRQALLDRYGGREAIGTKKRQGVLYGVSKDMWSALGIGLTWQDKTRGEQGYS